MAKRIQPKLVKGMRDQVGHPIVRRNELISTIRRSYERFGFQPLETPAVELLDVLSGAKAGETSSKIYHWNHEEDGVDLGLRFDLTVPLARFVAGNPQIRRPFKRYQVGPVYRVDKPGAGRFREFYQFDIDTVGTPSMLADAEILAAMAHALRSLGLPAFTIRWNHRGILNAALDKAGIAAKLSTPVIRILDKADKIGIQGVRAELGGGREDEESGAPISGLELAPEPIDTLLGFLDMQADTDDELIEKIAAFLSGAKGADDALRQVNDLRRFLASLGEGDEHIRLTPALARGMDYYTGPIFEATLDELPAYGSIMGGGRYNELLSRFSSEQLPGVGASIGLDRLLAALEHLQPQQERTSITQVLVTTMDKKMLEEYTALVQELREGGLNAEIYLKPKDRLGDQLRYASDWRIPFAVILGEDERAAGMVTVKDLEAGREASADMEDRQQWVEERPGQFQIAREDLLPRLKELLEL